MSATAAYHDTLAYRLTQILVKLNQGEKLDPQALADEFGVNLRTIQRDMNERFALPAAGKAKWPLPPGPGLSGQAQPARRRALCQPGRGARPVPLAV
jgi:hypothetical protein